MSAFLRFSIACFILGLIGWTIISAFVDAFVKAKGMYQVPCTRCRFFTNDHRLKCTINPYFANTEGAVGCIDYLSDWDNS